MYSKSTKASQGRIHTYLRESEAMMELGRVAKDILIIYLSFIWKVII